MASNAFSGIAEQVKLDLLSATHLQDNINKRKEVSRTFISDTITVPTPEMYQYATLATLGDDVYFEPSTKALEDHVAKITGKEAGLFMPSGTASNQIALRTHLLQPPILGYLRPSRPYTQVGDSRQLTNLSLISSRYEASGAAFHSGAAVLPLIPSNAHHLTVKDVKDNMVLSSDVHFAPTEVVALENTLNGTIFPQEEIVKISEYVHSQGKKMHLDGARIWHVAAETETSLKELCDPFDSVSLCFSKGLGAPVGSCLVGTTAFIAKARTFRKLFGGGMRQTGVFAACAAYALTHNFPLLPSVHALAKKLEAGLEEIGVDITSRAETCMIFYDPAPIGVTYEEIGDRASQLPEPLVLGGSRVVVHVQTSESAVDAFLSVVRELAEEKKKAGFVRPEPSTANGNIYKDVYVRRLPKSNA
ncbi:Beta-elim-lyase domain-containing protein [Mycena chlorophos]|uniref:Beta-elim-lyase domain-containing protein n=1 Tax=Mycena chlorophos TaxID=658473 RepID=A0A8H6T5F4_MYCCL|nr:Beta-elim-lyase domain-containing protein [Mycena chlorophos]